MHVKHKHIKNNLKNKRKKQCYKTYMCKNRAKKKETVC